MANKLFLVSATLALFFLLANASIYRTVVEFEEDDSTNPKGPRPQQECQKEFKEAEHLQSCQQWINKQVMQSGGGPSLGDFENRYGSQKMHPLLKKCCNELEEEEPVCVCPTLKKAAKAVRLQGQHGPFEKIKIYRVAKNLPEVCSIPQVDACPFKAIPFFPPYY